MSQLRAHLNAKPENHTNDCTKSVKGYKFPLELGLAVNTVPKHMHLFDNWSSFIEMNFNNIVENTNLRCQKQCHNDVVMLSGKNLQPDNHVIAKCQVDCIGRWRVSIQNLKEVKLNFY